MQRVCINDDYEKNIKNIVNERLKDAIKIRQELIEKGFIEYESYITKLRLINILFPNMSEKRKTKLFKYAKKLNLWNNELTTPVIHTFSRCREGCEHKISYIGWDFGDCYGNQIEYQQEVLELKLENIPAEFVYIDYSLVNPDLFKPLTNLFEFIKNKN